MSNECGPSIEFPGFQNLWVNNKSYYFIITFLFWIKNNTTWSNHLFVQIWAAFKKQSILNRDDNLLPWELSEDWI